MKLLNNHEKGLQNSLNFGKKLIIFVMAILCINMVSAVQLPGFGIDLEINPVNINIEPTKFVPDIWMCDHGVVIDDIHAPETRLGNYAFEGDMIRVLVFAFDKNKVEEIGDVMMTIGTAQGAGNDIEVQCSEVKIVNDGEDLTDYCYAEVGEEQLEYFDEDTMDFYECIFAVERPNIMYGEYWSNVEVFSVDGKANLPENIYWFFNPIVALSIGGDGTLFDIVIPGATSYSSTLLIGNDADEGSGVMLNLFMTGTSIYDLNVAGSMCPTHNYISLDNIRYYATNEEYSTLDDLETDFVNHNRNKDVEGYVNIERALDFNNLHNNAEIIQADWMREHNLYQGNLISTGQEMALTLRIEVPDPCKGSFTEGGPMIWAETV